MTKAKPPTKCYEPVADGKSGNMKLPVGCSYCSYKHECYPKLRTFIYSNGPKFLTEVGKVPSVLEVDKDGNRLNNFYEDKDTTDEFFKKS